MKSKEDKFLLLSLQEDKAKHLAKVISSRTSRKILDFLADNPSATATKISQVLQIPLNTTTYNLQQLVKGGLVISEEFHYSTKGREVDHYSLANKYIIIAPKETEGWKEKLRGILPLGGILLSIAAGWQLFQQTLMGFTARLISKAHLVSRIETTSIKMIEEAATETVTSGAPTAFNRSADVMVSAAPRATEMITQPTLYPMSNWLSITLWAVIIILFILSMYFLIKRIKKR